jgi:peptidoglycan/xylan/chitin deacetylase (PgdA/CDA1 family)
LTCDDGFLNNLTEMLPILQDEGLQCLFFVTGASTSDLPTMLWYEELFLLFLRAPAGDFKISAAGIEVGGVLAQREQRRALWWSAVKRLSQVDAESRESFLRAAHLHFGLERSLDYFLANYPETRRHFGLLTRADLQRLAGAGMTIGAHTLTHPILAQQPAELAWNEIVDGRALLESVIGKQIWAFAYPFGDASSVSPKVMAMVRQASFDAAFLNTGGGLGAELPVLAIPRVHEFEAHVSGFYESLRRGFGKHQDQCRPSMQYTSDTSVPSAKPNL